ncbi:MAG: alanine--tRNA ligase, partial [Gemmatimonadota bacterium]|nr:alanine--tRNA ligase [Gemmatimonadota bacterium]
ATALLLADGVLPDRTGRGYVLRKIMRRAVSQGVLLGVDRPFLAEAAGVVVEAMSDAFPILAEKEDALRTAAAQEEALFRRTVEEGMRRISDLEDQLEDESVWSLGPEGERILSGEVAFRLYDTYGCPLELTASVGVRRGYEVDEDGFLREMTRQKERSRKSWKGGGAPAVLDGFYASRRAVLGETRFTGYAEQEGEARVLAMARWSGDGLEEADRASEGDPVALVMESTPFYGEAGGQVGDTGELTGDGVRVRVEDTRRTAGGSLIVHMGRVEEGELSPGMRLTQRVDRSRREEVQRHHSATHLLHHALREVLGGHVSQKGSFVGQERLRFDFSHPEAVAPAALAEVEARVNELIRENHAVSTEETDPDSARAAGALAFFGEKYGDTVRVVGMGPSRELCGGTHVASTGDLGYCALVAEGSVASGVRRVEAFAGSPAVVAAWRARAELERIAGVLRTAPADVLARLGDLQEETRNLKARIEELERDAAGSVADRLVAAAVEASGTRVVAGVAPISERGALRDLADEIRLSAERTVVVLGATLDEKVALAAAVSDDLVKEGRIKAGDLVGRVAELVGGGGGGKPHLATAGGRDVAGLPGALEEVPGIVEALMSESAS